MAQSMVGSIFIIVACIVGALIVLTLFRRYWAPSKRLGGNDVVGPNVGIIGTTYAVLIAFMLSGVWNNLQGASLNAEQEANSLVNIYRFAYHLPPESKSQLQDLARQYCTAMIQEEWPAMAREQQSANAHRLVQMLWYSLNSVQPRNASEQTVMDHALFGAHQHDRASSHSLAAEPAASASAALGSVDCGRDCDGWFHLPV